MIPVAFVVGAGIWLKPHLGSRDLFAVIPRRHVEAARDHTGFNNTVTAVSRTVFGNPHKIDRRSAERGVDHFIVLEC